MDYNSGLSARFDRGAMTIMKPAGSTSGLAPPYPPPRAPSSSVAGKLLPSNNVLVPRRRNKSKKQRKQKKSSTKTDPSPEQTLEDPCPDHLNVADSPDDLSSLVSSLADFSVEIDQSPSPTSVADTPTLPGSPKDIASRKHRKSRSWDSSDSYQGSSPSKSCLPVPALFRRTKGKVMCADVASVSNASDTMVPIEKGGAFSGREIHESAKVALNAGNYVDAISMFEAIQDAQVQRFGENHPSVGAAMHNVGVVRLRMAHYEKAEAVLSRAVEIRRVVLDRDHLDLASSLAKLGSARVFLQDFDVALQDLREALRIYRHTLGRCHKTVAQTLCHIACLYFEADELFSAQATFEDALEIYREVFATETDRDSCMAQMTEALCNIGSIQNKRKNFADAINSFKEALDVSRLSSLYAFRPRLILTISYSIHLQLQRGIHGHDHQRVIATLDNLGYSYSKQRAYNQALACYREMMTAQLSHYGGLTTECCVTVKKQNLMYEKLKNLDGAIKETKKTLGKYRKGFTPSHPAAIEMGRILADLLLKREKQRGSF